MLELCDYPALDLRRMIARKEISPVELLESCIARIETVNPVLNAVVATNYERARSEARRAERQVRDGEELGLLHGLPVGIKDLQVTEGITTTYGSVVFKDNVPDSDEVMVAAIRREGGIVVAKTNTSEFGSGGNTTNKLYGPTGNAFNPALTCGGSSGGSGVALATSMLPLCTGSDTGGSLRKPAAWSGVVGFRPSPGVVPSDRRKMGWQPMSVLGPMGRTVDDTALLLRAIACGDPRDPFTDPNHPLFPERAVAGIAPADLSSLKVAISVDLGFAAVAPSIAQTFEAAIGQIQHLFKQADRVAPPLDGIKDVYLALRGLNFAASYDGLYEEGLLEENTANNVSNSLKYSLRDLAVAQREQTIIFRRLSDFYRDYDLLISPCQLMSPYPKTQLYPTENEGLAMSSYTDSSLMTAAISAMGHPAISLPCGLDKKNLPFGLQIVGAHKADVFTLAAARALEDAMAAIPTLKRPVPDIQQLAGFKHP